MDDWIFPVAFLLTAIVGASRPMVRTLVAETFRHPHQTSVITRDPRTGKVAVSVVAAEGDSERPKGPPPPPPRPASGGTGALRPTQQRRAGR